MPGETVTAVVKVHNRDDRAVEDLVVVDELSANAGVRSATSTAGTCEVAGRRATCRFDRVGPGETAVIEVRLQVDPASTARTVVQRITAGGNGHTEAAGRSVTQLVGAAPAPSALLALPGPTVTLVTFVGFVLASTHGGTGRLTGRPTPPRRR
ncbi:MAG TPA: hypothetical protein VIL36_16140 [Acidimicrobiales bacterium]